MRYLRRHWQLLLLSSVPIVLALLHTLDLPSIGLLRQIDAFIYDTRLRWSMPQSHDPRIVIIDIDEKSLAEVGRWPWSHHTMTRLTQILLEQQGVALLGFDVVFAEPDLSSGLLQLQRMARHELRNDSGFHKRLAELAPRLDYDAIFAQTLKYRPVVLGYYFTQDRHAHPSGQLPPAVMPVVNMPGQVMQMAPWSGFGANIPALAQAAPVAGFFNSVTDPDGVIRALPVLAQYAGKYYESLSLAMFRQLTGMPSVSLDQTTLAAGQVILQWPDRNFSIPVDRHAAMLIAYRGYSSSPEGVFEYLAASDLLAGRVATNHLKGKIALIGATAPGIGDLRATPVSSVYPGVEVQASALSGMLDRRFLHHPVQAQVYELLILLIVGICLAWVLPLISAPLAVASGFAVVTSVLAINSWLYLEQGLVLNVAPLLLMTILIYVLNIGHGYLAASRSRRELIQLFGTYVPPELVREMIKDPGHYTMRARSDELTVMFCDLRGFTTLSERLAPVDLQKFLNQVFSELTRLIGANRGTVDKYMGDCVMAFWGAPVESPAHAQLAVKTALQMAQALGQINQSHKAGALAHHPLEIELGIGLNTGQMYVGDMGSDIRRSYTVIGDAVNLGSRLEGLSKIYGVSVVASESTRQLADNFVWQELDRVRVKGKEQTITIFSPLTEMTQLSPNLHHELDLWQHLLDNYRAQNWQLSAVLIRQLLQGNPDKMLYQLYQQRIASKQGRPFDPDWDGATHFESK